MLALCGLLTPGAEPGWAQSAYVTRIDRRGDAVPRRTDPGALLPFDPEEHRLIDLLAIRLGRFRPEYPRENLFVGDFAPQGEFFRLDLVLAGLVNPPGSVHPGSFNPFAYGNHPVYGFVEIDMDEDVTTGGELAAPRYRYLGNVVRFGGNVAPARFRDRIATEGASFDGRFRSPPFVERSGEEFHLALLGDLVARGGILEVEGDGDATFDEGETWRLWGRFFHRAHGFERFSFVKGGASAGEYAPITDLQFRSEPDSDATVVSLVFPLTNGGAGLMLGQPPQPSNHDPSDQASVLEALADLQLSASFVRLFPTGLEEEELIVNWFDRDPAAQLNPARWFVTALLGTSYTRASGEGVFFLWTDVFPDVVPGDVNGSGFRDVHDALLILSYISQRDAVDGVLDGRVVIPGFAWNFTLFDVNHDGVVDARDVAVVGPIADADDDYDVDLRDFRFVQFCFSPEGIERPPCRAADLDGNGRVDLQDVRQLGVELTGPRVR